MARVFTEDHETGVSGTNLTTGNTNYDGFNPVGPVPTIATDQFVDGTRSMRITPSAGNYQYASYFSAGLESLRFNRFYFRINAWPTENVFMCSTQAAGAIRADLRLRSDHKIDIRNNTTAVWTSTGTLSLATWYRAEWRLDVANSQQEANIYLLHDTSPMSGFASGNRSFTTGTFDSTKWGTVAAAAGTDLWIDATAVDDADWVGPLVSATPLSIVVNASPSLINVGQTSTLTITPSDGAGTKSYLWSIPSGPSTSTGQLSSTTASTVTFTPSTDGSYTVRCVVTDDTGSPFDDVAVTVDVAQRMIFTRTVVVSG